MGHLISLYSRQKRWTEAEKLQMEVTRLSSKHFYPDHPTVIESMESLVRLYFFQPRIKEAADLQLEVVKKRERVQGLDHSCTIKSTLELSGLYISQGRLEEAEQVHPRKRLKLSLESEHPQKSKILESWAVLKVKQQRIEEAEESITQVIRINSETAG